MTKRLVAAIALLFLFGTAASSEPQSIGDSTGRLKIQVLSSSNNPLAGSFVYIHYAGAPNDKVVDVKTQVDEIGQFEVRLSPDSYDVFVAYNSYFPDCRFVHIGSGETTEITVKLKPIPSVDDRIPVSVEPLPGNPR